MSIQTLQQTGHAMTVLRIQRLLPCEPAAELYLSATEGTVFILPYVTFTVVIKESLATVARRLSEQVDHTSWFPFWTLKRMYTGRVWDSGFKVAPMIRYRNSFLPVICGSFEPQGPGTVVRMTMRLH